MQNPGFKSPCSDSTGGISPLALVVLMVSFAAATGLIGLYAWWQREVQTQFRLDMCAKMEASHIRTHMNFIVNTNRVIRALRAGKLVTVWFPAAAAAVETSVSAIVVTQEVAIRFIELRRLLWLNPLACGDFLDRKGRYPPVRWTRPPNDPLGPKPLKWAGGVAGEGSDLPARLKISVSHGRRTSVVAVYSTEHESPTAEDHAPAATPGSAPQREEVHFFEPYQMAWSL